MLEWKPRLIALVFGLAIAAVSMGCILLPVSFSWANSF